ncbi:MAG: ABC transporter permease [Clostridia bacterium]|nr:ABC transporter permease [Clostridia bacterium]
MTEQKKTREPLFHLVKRINVPTWQSWAIRGGTIVGGFLLIGILIYAFLGIFPSDAYKYMFEGAFGSRYRVMVLLRDLAILLLFALAVTPAFKMKFWNIGAEGQVLMGAYCCMVCLHYLGGKVNDTLLIFIALAGAVFGGAMWAVIPALFKAKWNTNETLFTLMMNYVSVRIIEYTIKVWVPGGTGVLPTIKYGNLPTIGGENFWFSIIVAIVFTGIMFAYLRFSKHGYEISVVGESENTARYIGINVKKVIVRTLILSGIICGVTGFLLVSGINHSLTSESAGGRGFTAILVSWLAKFNPIGMIFTSLLVVFLSAGTDEIMTKAGITTSFFSQVVTGLMFLIIIGGEFFINYKIVFRRRAETPKTPTEKALSPKEAQASLSEEASPASDEPSADVAKEENV